MSYRKTISPLHQTCVLLRKIPVLVLLLLAAGASHAVLAEDATFRNGLLTLPMVEDEGDTLFLELELIGNSFPPEFRITYSREKFAPVDIDSPYLTDNFLVIPELALGKKSYWLELRLTGIDLFTLDSYGLSQEAPAGYFGGPGLDDWIRIPGDARDIGVGADGTVWVLGGNTYPRRDFGFAGDNGNEVDFGLWVLEDHGWLEVPGSGVRLDVGPDGYPWVVNSSQEIWRLNSWGWERIHGRASDIGIGADGSVWVLGTTERRGGYEIFRLTGFGWQKVHGTGVRIDVDPNGVPWVINHDDHIFRLVGGGWERLPGLAKDIGIGADGSAWVIGTNSREGGYGIYHWNHAGWDKVGGSARQISAGPDGTPWVVNRDGEIYSRW